MSSFHRPSTETPHDSGDPNGATHPSHHRRRDSKQHDNKPGQDRTYRHTETVGSATEQAARSGRKIPESPTRARSKASRKPRPRVLGPCLAMGFVAALAITTSVPARSLVSPAQLSAHVLAVEATDNTQPGQHIEITGTNLAIGVTREDYQVESRRELAAAAGIQTAPTFTNNPNGTIQWPFAVGVKIGDRFGYRNCAGCSTDHGGQDFNPGLGAKIQAIAAGTVSVSTEDGGSLGTVTMIDHVINGKKITSVYAHQLAGSRRVQVGDTVTPGQAIGQVGNTGMSTGPHLHFEIRTGGVDGTKVDPLVWLQENTN
ncbi:MAG: hypothetical protein B5766_00575 [Candidatus Lumbricidophila eiseniae]|uniref:M23ase beta-sheet core domain-containing protein n=1 Tax=Candidatus Lumbricidiphila eiseniae TaxID=1969409 RepID=A0A2A6FV12_9MICO|nr:MAG: hypothetical protein B5766_00575 [Candidatus Lumbricidophila eiseniae]